MVCQPLQIGGIQVQTLLYLIMVLFQEKMEFMQGLGQQQAMEMIILFIDLILQ